MRPVIWGMVLLFILAPLARAADTPTPDQLKKMYDEVLVQLKNAQDRKNELAKENEGLKAKTEEMGKDLATAQAQLQDLKRDLADNAQKDFYLRAYHAAWLTFLSRYPDLQVRWNLFLDEDAATSTRPVVGKFEVGPVDPGED